jgi:perosamine synthetase
VSRVEVAAALGTRRIPVAAPALVGREREYVIDCIDSTWISSTGTYIERFEESFAGFCEAAHALSCSNGTVALHLALLALGVGPGDEVICPTLTYVATANAIAYCGATPIFVDSEPTTWNLDPPLVEAAVTSKTKAIIAVHLYGHPADMDAIVAIAAPRGIAVIEDAAEAHGASYKGRRVGTLGDIATFSFYGNKIITTGEGGMVVTNDAELAARVRQLKGQGQDPERRYWFPVIGFNYRMTNIAAAIGLAQLEQIDWHLTRRREIASWYHEELDDLAGLALSPQAQWAESAYWMTCVVLDDGVAISRDEVMSRLAMDGVETRPFFFPMHTLPSFNHETSRAFPVAAHLAERGMNLPSGANLTRDDIAYVAASLRSAIRPG